MEINLFYHCMPKKLRILNLFILFVLESDKLMRQYVEIIWVKLYNFRTINEGLIIITPSLSMPKNHKRFMTLKYSKKKNPKMFEKFFKHIYFRNLIILSVISYHNKLFDIRFRKKF